MFQLRFRMDFAVIFAESLQKAVLTNEQQIVSSPDEGVWQITPSPVGVIIELIQL